MTQSQHKDSWFVQLGLVVPPEAVIRRLWESLTRMCDRNEGRDDADAHLWAEGPLPGKLAGCLNCEEFQTQGRRKAVSGLPRVPWRLPQRLIVLCNKRDPLH